MSRPSGLAGLVLAAGAGSRLRPLTDVRPKPLCPVGFDALLDLALARVDAALGGDRGLAVNLCAAHGGETIDAHLRSGRWDDRVHRSWEPTALGTAGAVGQLRPWLDGRALLVVNGDTWCPASLRPLLDAWDGRRVLVAVSVPDDGATAALHARSSIVGSLLPWEECRRIEAVPAGLWELVWRPRLAAGELQVVGVGGPFVDCGTPADYLRANLEWSGGSTAVHRDARIAPGADVRRSVIGAGASVAGRVHRSVVWPGAVVRAGEELLDAVRTDTGLTVSVAGSAAPPEPPVVPPPT